MISPSPTQQPPVQNEPEQKKIAATPIRVRAGQTPAALFIKGLFRPVIKLLYVILRAIGSHKLVTLVMILLILASSTVANYAITGKWPFGIGNDPFNFHIKGGDGGGDQVKNWMYALRDGNITTLALLDKNMPNPPSQQQLQQYIDQFSQAKSHLSWKAINVAGAFSESDTTVDSFIQVDLSTNGPGGPVSGYMIWHFTSLAQNGGILLEVDVVAFRASLQ